MERSSPISRSPSRYQGKAGSQPRQGVRRSAYPGDVSPGLPICALPRCTQQLRSGSQTPGESNPSPAMADRALSAVRTTLVAPEHQGAVVGPAVAKRPAPPIAAAPPRLAHGQAGDLAPRRAFRAATRRSATLSYRREGLAWNWRAQRRRRWRRDPGRSAHQRVRVEQADHRKHYPPEACEDEQPDSCCKNVNHACHRPSHLPQRRSRPSPSSMEVTPDTGRELLARLGPCTSGPHSAAHGICPPTRRTDAGCPQLCASRPSCTSRTSPNELRRAKPRSSQRQRRPLRPASPC